MFWLIVITTTCKLFRIWILDCKILSIFPLERYFKTLSHYCAFHLQFSLAIIVRFSKNIKTANKFGSRDIFGFYLIFYDFAEKKINEKKTKCIFLIFKRNLWSENKNREIAFKICNQPFSFLWHSLFKPLWFHIAV